MIKKIAPLALVASIVFNVMLFTHGCQTDNCSDNPISECHDATRFHPQHKIGKCWAVDAKMQREYAARYTQSTPAHSPAVFISKKVLNQLFRSDNSANGVVCMMGIDAGGHPGILIYP